jgi:hypothetical protein
MIRERTQLISDIEAMRYLFPFSSYNGEVLLRLAELYYEQESETFDSLLDDYGQRIEAADARGDTSYIPEPELRFERTLAVYNELLRSPAYAGAAPAAMYYKALGCII